MSPTILWVSQWMVALVFYFIAMVKLGLETRLHTAEPVEIALSMLAILPAVTGVLPRLSTVALAVLCADGVVRLLHGTALAATCGTLAILAAVVALARLKLGYGAATARSIGGLDRPTPEGPRPGRADQLSDIY